MKHFRRNSDPANLSILLVVGDDGRASTRHPPSTASICVRACQGPMLLNNHQACFLKVAMVQVSRVRVGEFSTPKHFAELSDEYRIDSSTSDACASGARTGLLGRAHSSSTDRGEFQR